LFSIRDSLLQPLLFVVYKRFSAAASDILLPRRDSLLQPRIFVVYKRFPVVASDSLKDSLLQPLLHVFVVCKRLLQPLIFVVYKRFSVAASDI
jgi:hypothetical protein